MMDLTFSYQHEIPVSGTLPEQLSHKVREVDFKNAKPGKESFVTRKPEVR